MMVQLVLHILLQTRLDMKCSKALEKLLEVLH